MWAYVRKAHWTTGDTDARSKDYVMVGVNGDNWGGSIMKGTGWEPGTGKSGGAEETKGQAPNLCGGERIELASVQ